jgi:hypothetical protein
MGINLYLTDSFASGYPSMAGHPLHLNHACPNILSLKNYHASSCHLTAMADAYEVEYLVVVLQPL